MDELDSVSLILRVYGDRRAAIRYINVPEVEFCATYTVNRPTEWCLTIALFIRFFVPAK